MSELIGKWQGRTYLWLFPGDPVHESDSKAEVRKIGNGQFTEIWYTWAYDGEPQEGRLFLGQMSEDGSVKAVWFDSWHLNGIFMVFKGTVDEDETISLNGSYAAPSGPDWGWQIAIEPVKNESFFLRMYNIPPEEEKALAVEVEYSRRA